MEPTDRAGLSGKGLIDLTDLATSNYFAKVASTEASREPSAMVAMLRRLDYVDTFNVGFADIQRDRIKGAIK